MATARNTIGGSAPPMGCCSHCTYVINMEWEKIKKKKARLALEKKKLKVENDLLEENKRNFEVNKKIKMLNDLSQREHLQRQLAHFQVEFQQQQEEFVRKLRTQEKQKGLYTSLEPTSSWRIEQALMDCKESLAATQRVLASSFVELEVIQREKNEDELHEQAVRGLQEQQKSQQPNWEDTNRSCCSIGCPKSEKYSPQVEELEEGLRQLKNGSARATEVRHMEKQKWQEDREQELKKQLADLKQQLEANTGSMEESEKNNQSLKNQLENLETELNEQKRLVEKLQQTKGEVLKHHRSQLLLLESEKEMMAQEAKRLVSNNHELQAELEKQKRGDGLDHTSQTVNPMVIQLPSDLNGTQEDATNNRKHVVGWKYHNKNGLAGFYTGWLDATGNPDGHGMLRFADCSSTFYVGAWRKGMRQGHGVFVGTRHVYCGEWANNLFHGRGIYVWPDGKMYVGDFVERKRQGKGIETWPNGEHYEGDYFEHEKPVQPCSSLWHKSLPFLMR